MSVPPSMPPPISNTELEALVAAASEDDMRRALRIVLGAEQAYWERDLKTGRMWYSPAFFKTLGLPPTHEREAINARIHPDDRAQFEAAYAAALAGSGTFSYDVRYLDTSGDYRWARAFGRVWLDDADGSPLRLIGTLIDVHAERQARLDADAYALRYQRALEASSEAHFERTVGGDDFHLSDNFPRLLGHPPGTPPPDRRAFKALVHPDDVPALREAGLRASQRPGEWSATYRLRLADGGWRWFRGRGRTEFDAHGRLRMSGMIGDVHQQELDRRELDRHRHDLRAMVAERTDALHAALEEAKAQREQAERASNAKSEFLAHMSHELRTPLNGVLGLTELALKLAEQPSQRRYLDVALRSGRGLLQLIGEVLDLSRLEAGALELAQQPFDLAELLADVLRTQMADAQAKSLSVRFDWTGDVTRVLGDAARVRQVATNIAANAVKFTERGHVTLRGELVSTGHDGLLAKVRVEDTGPGIPAAQQERVFEAFVQGDGSLTRQYGGSGLGLAIARRMARAMGGDVVLERSSPAGSSFVFSWPVRLDPAAPPLPTVGPGRAWLVYRNVESGQWLQQRLARLGWSSALHAGLESAEAEARRSPPSAWPDVVLVSDKVLDAQTDFAALRAALPVARIALLVRPQWDEPALERKAAAQRIEPLVLPLGPRALHGLLAPRAEAAASAPAPLPTPAQAARVLVVEDNAVNLMITEEFLRQLGHAPHGAPDGAAAIAACEQRPPALVLMDLQMPVMDGFETTRRLRRMQQAGRLPAFPIIALTAHAGEADRRLGEAAGMDDYLTKPILIDALRAALSRWLH